LKHGQGLRNWRKKGTINKRKGARTTKRGKG
jgi:hypothetical protein